MMWTKTGDKSGDDPLAMMYFKEADASKDEDENDPLAMMWWKPVDDDPDTIEEAESLDNHCSGSRIQWVFNQTSLHSTIATFWKEA